MHTICILLCFVVSGWRPVLPIFLSVINHSPSAREATLTNMGIHIIQIHYEVTVKPQQNEAQQNYIYYRIYYMTANDNCNRALKTESRHDTNIFATGDRVVIHALRSEIRHDDNLAVTCDILCCPNDNLCHQQWWLSWHNKSWFSVWVRYLKWLSEVITSEAVQMPQPAHNAPCMHT